MPKTFARVTDHALLRYFERVLGVDVEKHRRHVLALCTPALSVGAFCLRAEGVKFQFRGDTVVTITPDGPQPSRTAIREMFADSGA